MHLVIKTNHIHMEEISSQFIELGRVFEQIQRDINEYRSLFESLFTDASLEAERFIMLDNAFKCIEVKEERLAKILIEYQWLITYSTPESFVSEILSIHEDDNAKNKQEAIDKLYLEYFTKDNYQHLERMIKSWKSPLVDPRMKIILNCFLTFRRAKDDTCAADVIIPTLLTQIDGILGDILEYLGFKLNENGKFYESTPNPCAPLKPDLKGKYYSNIGILKNIESKLDPLDEAVRDLILNRLFQTATRGQELTFLTTFTRHKIMHGNCLDYGTTTNVLRAFLVLDFLINIDFQDSYQVWEVDEQYKKLIKR